MGVERFVLTLGRAEMQHAANAAPLEHDAGRHRLPAAEDFETILRVNIREPSAAPIFGPDNQLMRDVEYPDTVFRKTNRSGSGAWFCSQPALLF